MFRALERPVIVRNPNERKRIEAQAAVQAVVKKYFLARELMVGVVELTYWFSLISLGKRLPRMPFPPATKESNFEYEAALDEHVRGFLVVCARELDADIIA